MSVIKCSKCGEEYDPMWSFHSCKKSKKEKSIEDYIKEEQPTYWDFVKRDWWWVGGLMLVKAFSGGFEGDEFIGIIIGVVPLFLGIEWIRYKLS